MKQQTQINKIEWREVKFLDSIREEASNNKLKLKGKEFLTEGKYPIIDQGEKYIAGYTNDKNKIYNKILPVIIFGDHTRILKFINFPFALGADGVKILVSNENVSSKYLFYAIRSLKLENLGYSRHYKLLKNKKIPLPFSNNQPDIAEQERIVSILEKAEKQKERCKKAEELLDEYLKSVFNEMFYNKGFEEKRLGEICKIVSGSTPSTSKSEYWNGEINWVTPAELIDGHTFYYFESQRKITEEGLKSCSAEIFPEGTVLLTSRAPIGKLAISGNKMCSNQGFKNLIPLEKINSIYLYFWLLQKKQYLNSLGNGATFKEISKKIVSNILIPLPPLPLQQKFANIVEQVEKMKEKIKKNKLASEELFNSLMQKAFRGEL